MTAMYLPIFPPKRCVCFPDARTRCLQPREDGRAAASVQQQHSPTHYYRERAKKVQRYIIIPVEGRTTDDFPHTSSVVVLVPDSASPGRSHLHRILGIIRILTAIIIAA